MFGIDNAFVGPMSDQIINRFMAQEATNWQNAICDFFGERDHKSYIIVQTSQGQLPAVRFSSPSGGCDSAIITSPVKFQPWIHDSLPESHINRMSLASRGGHVLPYSAFAPLCDKAKAMAQRMTGSSRGVSVVIVSPAEGNLVLGLSCDTQESSMFSIDNAFVGPMSDQIINRFMAQEATIWQNAICDFFSAQSQPTYIIVQTSQGQLPAVRFSSPSGDCGSVIITSSVKFQPWIYGP